MLSGGFSLSSIVKEDYIALQDYVLFGSTQRESLIRSMNDSEEMEEYVAKVGGAGRREGNT